jgi:hypothetical protein
MRATPPYKLAFGVEIQAYLTVSMYVLCHDICIKISFLGIFLPSKDKVSGAQN